MVSEKVHVRAYFVQETKAYIYLEVLSKELGAMALISIQMEDQLEGASNFNTWKARLLCILKKHDLYAYVTLVSEEPLSNVGIIQE